MSRLEVGDAGEVEGEEGVVDLDGAGGEGCSALEDDGEASSCLRARRARRRDRFGSADGAARGEVGEEGEDARKMSGPWRTSQRVFCASWTMSGGAGLTRGGEEELEDGRLAIWARTERGGASRRVGSSWRRVDDRKTVRCGRVGLVSAGAHSGAAGRPSEQRLEEGRGEWSRTSCPGAPGCSSEPERLLTRLDHIARRWMACGSLDKR